MLMATIQNTAIDMTKSTTCKPARRPADARTVVIGAALLAVDAVLIEMRAQLKALGIDPEPVIGPLWEGHHKTSENIDRALARRVK